MEGKDAERADQRNERVSGLFGGWIDARSLPTRLEPIHLQLENLFHY